MTKQLPGRPNLEQLKKQAKSLLHAAQAKESTALLRFRTLPAFATKPEAELAALPFALHDAQSTIAREHGFPSWNALREHVEERTLSFTAAIDEFVRCATGGASGRARWHRSFARFAPNCPTSATPGTRSILRPTRRSASRRKSCRRS